MVTSKDYLREAEDSTETDEIEKYNTDIVKRLDGIVSKKLNKVGIDLENKIRVRIKKIGDDYLPLKF